MRSTRFFAEKIGAFKLVQQNKFDKAIHFPRWGCYTLSHGGMPQFALLRVLTLKQWVYLYHNLMSVGVLKDVDGELHVTDSTRLVRIVADYMEPGALMIKHQGDETVTWGPYDFQTRMYETKRGGDHWVLERVFEDGIARKIYDPGLPVQVRHKTDHFLKWMCRKI